MLKQLENIHDSLEQAKVIITAELAKATKNYELSAEELNAFNAAAMNCAQAQAHIERINEIIVLRRHNA